MTHPIPLSPPPGWSVSLTDSHVHLHHDAFAEDVDHVIERALEAGTKNMVTIACSFEDGEAATRLAERYDALSCSVGIHPHEADKVPDLTVEDLLKQANHPKVVAFGETGLDFYYNNSAEQAQKHSFRVHIEAARETGLPLVIHARNADDAIADMLEEEMKKGPFKPLLHCFAGGADLAERAADLGAYFSLSGIITFKNAKDLCEIVTTLPEDRLLLETDAPYLAPVPYRGKRNEPALLVHTAQKLAEIRGWSLEETAEKTERAFANLFGSAHRAG